MSLKEHALFIEADRGLINLVKDAINDVDIIALIQKVAVKFV